MYTGKIIDMHAHIYPAKIAEKAVAGIERFYGIYAGESLDGTPETLIKSGQKYNVVKYLMHSTATKREQVEHINDFIISQINAHDVFVGFGTLHFDMTAEDIDKELSRIKAAGIRGIKLHPDCQHFYIDDPIMDKIYSACADYEMPILIHVGDDRYDYSRPIKMAKTAERFSKGKYIAAHFGGYSCWDTVECYLGLDNVWFDTSSTLFKLSHDRAVELIKIYGPERFFFGTDYPLFNHDGELERFYSLPLDDETQKKIMYDNAVNFLGL